MNDEADRYNPFALIGVVLLVLLGFVAFFISFVTVPLVLLVAFYLWLSLRDRAGARRRRSARDAEGADSK